MPSGLLHHMTANEDLSVEDFFGITFNIKVTDISEINTPFIIFEDRQVNNDGFIFLENEWKSGGVPLNVNPCSLFPWLRKPCDIEHRTLKIEVIFKSELILNRYLHMNKLYPIEYPKIALQISNNIYQSQYMVYKENKLQEMLKTEESVILPQALSGSMTHSLIRKQERNRTMVLKKNDIFVFDG